jgi:threonine dehydrogenase-like Zn-dependent dehydrogenase
MRLLLKKIEDGQINPAEIISHRLRLEDAPHAYKSFRQKEDHCVKVVMKP